MKMNIEIAGEEINIWLNHNGKIFFDAYKVVPDKMGYSQESGDFDNFVEELCGIGEMTDELAEAMKDLESAVAEAVYQSLEG